MFSSIKKTVRGAIVIAIIVVGTMATFSSTASAVTTTYASGNVGKWWGSDSTNNCTTRQVTTLMPYVTGTPDYPNSRQTIYMIPRLDYSTDGVNWHTGGQYGTWQSRMVTGYQVANRFNAQSIAVPGRYYWRVAMDFRWYVGSTEVGRVVDLFTKGPSGWGEYWGGNGADVAYNGDKYFCLIY